MSESKDYPRPYPPTLPYLNPVRGVPQEWSDVYALVPQTSICFYPEEIVEIIRKARGKEIPITMIHEDTEITQAVIRSPFNIPLATKVDQATAFWLKRLHDKFKITPSEALRLGVFLLMELLRKEGYEI